MTSREKTVSIRPTVSILSVLRHLNYRAWFALAEFVDNAIQSYNQHREVITAQDGKGALLKVDIELNPDSGGTLVIRDNAAGISAADFPRAFRPAEIPPERTGLSEFGMGMKSAACWFSPNWTVRTCALGEPVLREVYFDITRIVEDNLEELGVVERAAPAGAHFTEITLTNLYRLPRGRTIGKVKEHLAEIYRVFTRNGTLKLTFDGDELTYEAPGVLVAPEYSDENQPLGTPKEWKKDIDFDFGGGLSVRGFAALRETASTTAAGFSLFRRNRLIVGSADEKYRPQELVGTPNTYQAQRVFGELHLDGFEVSHTKDGFQWDDNEEPFLALLREQLDASPLRLLRQARNYRTKPHRADLHRAAERVTELTGNAIQENLVALVQDLRDPTDAPAPPALPSVDLEAQRVIDVEVDGVDWRIVLELATDQGIGNWLDLSTSVVKALGPQGDIDQAQLLGLRISLAHPFVERFAGADADKLEPLVRLAAGIGLAEKLARQSGGGPGAVRFNLNRILRDALSRS
jgi:hypothetical protein